MLTKFANFSKMNLACLCSENAAPRYKRRYITLRIPHSVLERVHRRLSSKFGVR